MKSQERLSIAFEHLQAGRLAAAEQIVRSVLSVEPANAEALCQLGMLAAAAKQLAQAEMLLRQAVDAEPRNPTYHCRIGLFQYQNRRLDEAIASYRAALELAPDYPDALNNYALAMRDMGKTSTAVSLLQRAIALRGDYVEAISNLAEIRKSAGEFRLARDLYGRALQIRPDSLEARINLGHTFELEGQLGQAVEQYKLAVAQHPNSADAHYNLANGFKALEMHSQAQGEYGKAIDLRAGFFNAHLNLANSLMAHWQLDAAVQEYHRALVIEPDSVKALNNLGNALSQQGQIEAAIECYRRASAIDPGFVTALDNLIFTLHDSPSTTPQQIREELLRWKNLHGGGAAMNPPPSRDCSDGRALRVGLVSPNLCDHPISRFIRPLLGGNESMRLELFCYASVLRPDKETIKLKSLAANWRDIARLSDEQAASIIREDQIDILIDLAMHTADNRLKLFSLGPAPIGVSYLAYAGEVGNPAIQPRLTDRYLDPQDITEPSLQQRVYLPGTYWCYEPQHGSPPVCTLPALSAGCITFGSMNRFTKINSQLLDLWAKTAQPGARFAPASAASGQRPSPAVDRSFCGGRDCRS